MKSLFLTNEYPPHVYGGAGVHVDGGQPEVQFGGQFAKPAVDPLAQAAAVPGEQFDVRSSTGFTGGAAHHGQSATRPIG